MKIYVASGDVHTALITKHKLLSYYDLEISTVPFRKKTYELIKEHHEKTGFINRAGEGEAGPCE